MENSQDDQMPHINNSPSAVKIINDSGGASPAITAESLTCAAAQRDAAKYCGKPLADLPPPPPSEPVADVEEGIIFRNPQSSGNNSKVHFISNLTLIAKQHQSPRTSQNIIFLNNGPSGHQSTAAAPKLNCSPATPNYINAFVSKGIATTASGKVVNLLQPGAKGTSGLVAKTSRGKGIPLQKQPRNVQMVGRTAGGQLHTQKPANIVINTSKAAAAAGKFTSCGPATTEPQKLNVGKFAKASALMAQNKLRPAAVAAAKKATTVQVSQSRGGAAWEEHVGQAPYPSAIIKVQGKPNLLKAPPSTNKNVVYSQVVVSSNGSFAVTAPGKGSAAVLRPQPKTTRPVKYGEASSEGDGHAPSVIQFGATEQVVDRTTDEVYYVNGTQMSDEMSARLLQNFSQKAASRFAAQNLCLPVSPSANFQYSAQPKSIEHSGLEFAANSHATSASEEFLHSDGNNNGTSDNTRPLIVEGGSGEREDSSICGEMRPAPSLSTDERTNALHAVLQDHTYVLIRPSNEQARSPVVVGPAPSQLPYNMNRKELGVALALADVGNRKASQESAPKCTTNDLLNAAMGLGHYPLSFGPDDDDNCSVISNDSRTGRVGDNDLGEETETAPEGEGEEEDSVTRCICDLDHDDGYMICCDKCSTWQHVDCMGIDRLNIPDEYNCDLCHPRNVDRVRARALQIIKRREQQNANLMHAMGPFGVVQQGALECAPLPGGALVPLGDPKQGAASPLKKGKPPMASRRKSELGAAFAVKKPRKDLLKNGGPGSRRKEKKTLTKKRNVIGLRCETGGSLATDEKPLKSSVDLYETAITNHYSPELRARLQAISKQQQHHQTLQTAQVGKGLALVPGMNAQLRNIGDLIGKCTTVPHAGGKILISTVEIACGEPIVELRGKYMLSGQYRQTAMSGNRNQSRPGGPFIFFYRLVKEATELCVDTRTYGNDARFVRRSCRPNAEIVHHIEKGTIHLYIVSVQAIRSSTEITIKHEPHDLLAVSRASVNSGGVIPQPTSTSCGCGLDKDCLFYRATTEGMERRATNGSLPVKSLPRVTDAPPGGGPLKRRNSKVHLRNSRSTSSSGESNASLMSPNLGLASVASDHASPVSPMTTWAVTATPAEEQKVVEEVKTEDSTDGMKCVPVQPIISEVKVELKEEQQQQQEDGCDPVEECKGQQLFETQQQWSETVVKEEPHELVVKVEEKTEPSDEKKEPGTVVLRTSDSHPLSASKKNKELKSLNENTKLPQRGGHGEENRKLTREERKMEAIMKAFEKMEKSSSRKQEGRKNSTCGTESSLPRRRSSISNGKSGDDLPIFRKKKRKGSKSYQQNQPRRIRRKSSLLGPDELFTSEESTGSLLASPPISVPYSYASARDFRSTSSHRDQNSAVNMLLSLANSAPAQEALPVTASASTPLSSAYMLVEAALGPLTDFKVPKTKKSIMNDWLSADKSGEDSPSCEHVPHSTSESVFPVDTVSVPCARLAADSDCSAVGQRNGCELPEGQTATFATPSSGAAGSESAVKKRWLRQAISEECSDDAPASPTNGYAATPLKKRRFARQCSDMPEETPGVVETTTETNPPPVATVAAHFAANEDAPKEEESHEAAATEEVSLIATKTLDAEQEDLELAPLPIPPVVPEVIQRPATEPEAETRNDTIIPEEFDIEPLHPEEKSRVEGLDEVAKAEDAADEIADIQKRLHSFHAENILFLKSLNKKTKPNLSPQNVDCLSAYSSASVSASSSANSSPISSPKSFMGDPFSRRLSTGNFLGKRKRLDFGAEEPRELDREDAQHEGAESPGKQVGRRRTKSRFSSPVHGASGGIELKDLNSNTLCMVVKEDDVPANPTSTHSYYPADAPPAPSVIGGHHQPVMIPPTLGGIVSAGVPPLVPPPYAPTLFGGFGASSLDVVKANDFSANLVTPSPANSSRLLLSELLENAQKISHPLVSSTSGLLKLDQSPLTHSKMTFMSESTCGSAGNSQPAARSLIRTASADPRLNPNLNPPPDSSPAPKRKLSINEYRKRMQQTPSCGNDSANSSGTGSPTGFSGVREASGIEDVLEFDVGVKESLAEQMAESLGDSSCESPPRGESRDPTEKGTFCAAPTLLERQQESISERLKNYKSVTELLTTKDGTPIIKTILQNSPLGTSIIDTLRSSSSSVREPQSQELKQNMDGGAEPDDCLGSPSVAAR